MSSKKPDWGWFTELTHTNESNVDCRLVVKPYAGLLFFGVASHFISGVPIRRAIEFVAFWPNFLAYNTPVNMFTVEAFVACWGRLLHSLITRWLESRELLPKNLKKIFKPRFSQPCWPRHYQGGLSSVSWCTFNLYMKFEVFAIINYEDA